MRGFQFKRLAEEGVSQCPGPARPDPVPDIFQFGYLWLLSPLVIVPTGEDPDTLIWPMPVEYKGGDEVVALDSRDLHFHVNFESPEMTKAINR